MTEKEFKSCGVLYGILKNKYGYPKVCGRDGLCRKCKKKLKEKK